ncbi:hypothetical protein ACHAWF_010527 [Thalassiosira exigua]
MVSLVDPRGRGGAVGAVRAPGLPHLRGVPEPGRRDVQRADSAQGAERRAVLLRSAGDQAERGAAGRAGIADDQRGGVPGRLEGVDGVGEAQGRRKGRRRFAKGEGEVFSRRRQRRQGEAPPSGSPPVPRRHLALRPGGSVLPTEPPDRSGGDGTRRLLLHSRDLVPVRGVLGTVGRDGAAAGTTAPGTGRAGDDGGRGFRRTSRRRRPSALLPALDSRHPPPRRRQGDRGVAHGVGPPTPGIGREGLRAGAGVGLLGTAEVRRGGQGADDGTGRGDGVGVAEQLVALRPPPVKCAGSRGERVSRFSRGAGRSEIVEPANERNEECDRDRFVRQ